MAEIWNTLASQRMTIDSSSAGGRMHHVDQHYHRHCVIHGAQNTPHSHSLAIVRCHAHRMLDICLWPATHKFSSSVSVRIFIVRACWNACVHRLDLGFTSLPNDVASLFWVTHNIHTGTARDRTRGLGVGGEHSTNWATSLDNFLLLFRTWRIKESCILHSVLCILYCILFAVWDVVCYVSWVCCLW